MSRLRKRMAASADELAWAICLDPLGRILCCREIAYGSRSAVTISIRAIVTVALAHDAAGLILIHNHPSGDPTPSIEDLRTTRCIMETLRALEITLLDHVVIGGAAIASMRDLALM